MKEADRKEAKGQVAKRQTAEIAGKKNRKRKIGKKLTWRGRRGQSCGFHCIKIKHIGVRIGTEEILKDVNLHIHCGNLTAVIGRNGAGKSTLLKAILGEVPHEGEILFTDLRKAGWNQESKEERNGLRVGYVPQSLSIDKNTPVSVYDLLAGYISRRPLFFWKSRRTEEQIREQLSMFQAEDLLDKAICDLSGGELQRVLLALATMPPPNLLVLDEPAAGIDQKGIASLYEILRWIKEEYDMAVILVSHDLEYVKKYADQVVLLDKTVRIQGTAKKVFESEVYAEVFGKG